MVALRVGGVVTGQGAPVTTWQAVGRTPGDLIVAVDVSEEGTARGLVGSIASVRVTEGRPLLLVGRLGP
jgi:hypothetical protein